MASEFDTDATDFPTCPACGYEDRDECDMPMGETWDQDCPSCGHEYRVSRTTYVVYSTSEVSDGE